MSNIEIKETEYYNCPYCKRIIPDYAICNCVKIYNQALEDMRNTILTDKELQFAPYSQDMWFKNRIYDIVERLTK